MILSSFQLQDGLLKILGIKPRCTPLWAWHHHHMLTSSHLLYRWTVLDPPIGRPENLNSHDRYMNLHVHSSETFLKLRQSWSHTTTSGGNPEASGYAQDWAAKGIKRGVIVPSLSLPDLDTHFLHCFAALCSLDERNTGVIVNASGASAVSCRISDSLASLP